MDSISLPSFLGKMLKVHRKKPLERQLKIGEAWENRDLVFPDLHEGYFNQRYLIWLFMKLLREVGVPRMHFHDLRHSAATILLAMAAWLKRHINRMEINLFIWAS